MKRSLIRSSFETRSSGAPQDEEVATTFRLRRRQSRRLQAREPGTEKGRRLTDLVVTSRDIIDRILTLELVRVT
ncbi:MAG: hypothetical protein WBD43_04225, partial [Methylovirgula sp.]